MVSDLFFYQLLLVALVWLCVMLHWVWPSDPAMCPTTPEPTPPLPKRHREPKPFAGLTTKPHCDACEHGSAPRPQAPSAPPPRIVLTRGRRRQVDTSRISARTRTVPIGAGSAGAISAPMAIPMVVPGGNCCVSPVAATFSRPSARSFMASAPPSTSSCASSPAWPKAWASGARRGCSRWTPIRCCSGWSRRRTSCRPSPGISCTTYGSEQVQLDELFALLSAVKDGTVSEAEAIERLERSPQWVWVAMDPESKLLLAIDVGRSHPGDGPTRCPPGRAGVGPRLCPAVSHRWLSGVYDGLADPLWALGAAATPPGQRPGAQAALDAPAAVALRAGGQDRAPPAPGRV